MKSNKLLTIGVGMLVSITLCAIGNFSNIIKTDNFGYRLYDQKIAIIVTNPGSIVQLKDSSTGNTIATITAISFSGIDTTSSDSIWNIDFSTFTTQGDYYIYVPSLNIRSYCFRISNDVYNNAGITAAKSFYYQRCNSTKENPYSGPWQDTACHLTDYNSTPASGQTNYGTLDLHGGFHDAGDYQKTAAWDRGTEYFLWAYELHPAAWKDNQLTIPESGNKIPDLLDQIKWELDFYVLMQRSDGHFLSSQRGINGTIFSPPSKSDETRNYYDDQPTTATAECTMKLAHAATVFKNAGFASIANTYVTAARGGWTWLNGQTLTGTDNDLKCGAASALYRLDSTVTTAKTFVENYTNWSAVYLGPATYDELDWAVWQYLKNPNGNPTIQNNMKTAVGNLVNLIFGAEDAYSGLRIQDWNWGSNQYQGSYGSKLLLALYFGVTGSYTPQEVSNQAERYLHYMHGFNPMNMVYLTNMASIGGEHSSFQTFHSWFSYLGGNGETVSNPTYNGKPTGVTEPAYPYYAADTETSQYGPAPGLVVGGADAQYDGIFSPPKGNPTSKCYRDWSVPGCDWNGSACVSESWEITETDLGYTSAYLLLASYFMTDTTGTLTALPNYTTLSINRLEVYPNPATDHVTLSVNVSTVGAYRLCIYNILGQEVYQQTLPLTTNKLCCSIDIENFKSGIYIISLEGVSNNYKAKFVKE